VLHIFSAIITVSAINSNSNMGKDTHRQYCEVLPSVIDCSAPEW